MSVASCGPNAEIPTTPGNLPSGAPAVQLFIEPEEGAQPVVRFIDGSKQTLDVAMYLLSDRPVVTALENAAKRGVHVRVMLEEHPYGSGPGNEANYQRLKSAGISVSWSPPEFTLSHDKYAVADRRTGLVGTANWTTSAFAENREYIVVDDDPSDVAALTAIFDADWSRQAVTVDDARLVVSPTNSRSSFLALIRGSATSLDLEAEEMQDQEIEDALGQAAKRGVTVRAIVPAPTGGTDANAAGKQKITANGVKVRQLGHPYVHAKDIIVDKREAFIGSENISNQSLNNNREVGIVLVDSVAIGRLDKTFSQDWGAATS
jgi:phosphatidylserine/phosphatidylglycerophosphate/cardiolipin synthase-like enzyme